MVGFAPFSIRPARVDDAPAIASLCDELRAHVGDPTGNFSADVIMRDGFGERPEFEICVAASGDQVVGYALYFDTYEPAYAAKGLYLADLCVTAAERRRGIGRALIDEVGRIAAARGRSYVFWLANPKNTSALAAYERMQVDVIVPSVAHVRILPQR